MDWWKLGEYRGQPGGYLAYGRITCAFCGERGHWELEYHAEKKKPNSGKKLSFDTLRCGNCAGYVMVLWSGSRDMHEYRVLPWPNNIDSYPEHWPADIGRYWLQAKQNLAIENWDAAVIMTCSAMQLLLRSQGATGKSLFDEVNSLVETGILPPILREWADEIRWLRLPATHPAPGQPATNPKDATDVVYFLDFLLEYLLDLPNSIAQYRDRKGTGSET